MSTAPYPPVSQVSSPATRIATRGQQRQALLICLLAVFSAALVLPVAQQPLFFDALWWAASQSVLILIYFLTAYCIFSHYRVTRSLSLLYLCGACLYTCSLLAVQYLSMHGLLTSHGQQIGKLQNISAIWCLWHVGIPIGVLLHAVSEWLKPGAVALNPIWVQRRFLIMLGFIIGGSIASIGIGDDLLPHLGPKLGLKLGIKLDTVRWVMVVIELLTYAALFFLWKVTRLRTVLSIWLSVALVAMLCDNMLTLAGGARQTIGWYAGRLNAMVSSVVLLLVYLREIKRLYLETMEHARQLTLSNTLLEMRVNERTADLLKANKELSQSKAILHQLSSHRHRIKEKERKRIAQEIHDELGQNLLALRIDVAMMHARTSDEQPLLHQRVTRILGNIDITIQSVRAIINDLRPATLSLGLHAAIEWQVQEFERVSGISCTLKADDEGFEPEADEESTLAVFRLLQESLTNIVRHAKATAVIVSLEKTDVEILLTVTDNGIGMKTKDLLKKDSFGLLGMKERIQALGGRLMIDSVYGSGTVLRATIPVGKPVSASASSASSASSATP